MHSWNLCWPSVVRIFAISPLLELILFGLVYSCYALEFLTRFYFVSTWSLNYRVVFDALFLICGYFQSSFMYDLMPILKPMFWDRRCLLFLVSYPFDFHYVFVLLYRTICCNCCCICCNCCCNCCYYCCCCFLQPIDDKLLL